MLIEFEEPVEHLRRSGNIGLELARFGSFVHVFRRHSLGARHVPGTVLPDGNPCLKAPDPGQSSTWRQQPK